MTLQQGQNNIGTQLRKGDRARTVRNQASRTLDGQRLYVLEDERGSCVGPYTAAQLKEWGWTEA